MHYQRLLRTARRDRLLECVADRLKRHFDDTDHLANLGGGTFAAVITQPGHSDHALRLLNEQLTTLFNKPVSVNGRDIRITIKFGLAEFPENGEDATTLLENAEAALRNARESGERYLHHRLEMNSEVADRLALEQRLSTALAEQQFLLYYQPEIEIASARIIGLEALLRWRDPSMASCHRLCSYRSSNPPARSSKSASGYSPGR